ncbi:MAG: hypothetical protein IRY99_24770, partial [Isosphaeraceae bacterium]|nr:hypothetical protein [Isosphaeraceae bacterium]
MQFTKAQATTKAAVPAGGGANASAERTPPIALDRFQQAAQLARMAARHDMPALSLRAIRATLSGGPPVQGGNQPPFGTVATSMGIVRTFPSPGAIDNISVQVEQIIAELEPSWRKTKAEPAAVYETLRSAVLPEARPGEIFLYPRPLAYGAQNPRSVGRLLAAWAVRAGKVEDLKQRIEARKGQPIAELPALVLLGQLGLEAQDQPLLSRILDALAQRLQKDSLQTTTELACHVAVPALGAVGGAPGSLAVLEQAAKNLASQPNEEPLGGLLILMARYKFDHGDVEGGRQKIQDYLSSLDRVANRQPDYSAYRRRIAYQRAAREYIRVGMLSDALDMLGQYADTPTTTRYGVPDMGNIVTPLLRMLAAQPVPERYALLREWTMPASNRKSIRLLACALPADAPPQVFGTFPIPDQAQALLGPDMAENSGVASTAGLLIDAARQIGQLDELAEDAQKAADQKLENARALLILVQRARGQGAAVEPLVKELRDELAERWKPQP